MTTKTIQKLVQELHIALQEHERLVLELRRHPGGDMVTEAKLIEQITLDGNEALRNALSLSVETLLLQQRLLKQALYMLGPSTSQEQFLLN